MVRVILKRIGLAFLTLFGVTVIVFALLQMMPGEPIDSIVPLDASEELRQVIIDQYGFDPLLVLKERGVGLKPRPRSFKTNGAFHS